METTKKSLTTKQLVLLVFVLSTAVKLFTLPTIMIKQLGRSSIVFLVAFLLLDVLALLFLSFVSSRNKDLTCFEIVSKRVGVVVAKIIYALIFACVFVKITFLLLVTSNFVSTNLLHGTNNFIVLIPLLLVLAFFFAGSLRAVGRTCEIMIYFILIALVVLMVLVGMQSKLYSIFPILENMSKTTIVSAFKFPIWFGDTAILFVALGRVKKHKKFKTIIGVSTIVCIIAIVVCSIVIYSVYVDVAPLLDDGKKISGLTYISVLRLNSGRFDKIMFTFWIVSVVITLGMYALTGRKVLQFIVPIKNKAMLSGVFMAVLYVFCLAINTKGYYSFLTSYGGLFAVGLQYGFPLLMAIMSLFKIKGDSYEKRIPYSNL